MTISKIILRRFVLFVLCLSFIGVLRGEEFSNLSKVKSDTFDIIPFPKHFQILKNYFPIQEIPGDTTEITTPDGKRIKVVAEPVVYNRSVIIIGKGSGKMTEIATSLINNHIESISGKPLEIINEKDIAGNLPKDKNIILLGISSRSSIVNKLLGDVKKDIGSYPLEEQGYVIHFINNKQVVLTGLTEQGLLYSAITFNYLIDKEGNDIFVRMVNIVDCPDFKYRMVKGPGAGIKTLESGKELVDWALQYKFNVLDLWHRHLPPKEVWPILKELNTYARERGIRICYSSDWDIGSVAEHKDDKRFSGAIQFLGNYYCWSRDELLRERIKDFKSFIRETGADTMYLHCLDSYDANWPERCEKCKQLFGDNRAKADAHVINIYVEELRSVNRDMMLGFVTQPYGLNLNLPGNEKYKEYYKELTTLIPENVFLAVTGYSYDTAISWNEIIKQPLVRWQNGTTTIWGRYFDTTPSLLKGLYFPERKKDIVILNEVIGGYFDCEIMQLVGIEYMWNTTAAGANIMKEDKNSKIITSGPYHLREHFVVNGRRVNFSPDPISPNPSEWNVLKDPVETSGPLLERVCRVLYGNNIAPIIAEYLRQGMRGWRGPSMAANFANTVEDANREYIKAKKATDIIKNALQNEIKPNDRGILMKFYGRSMHPMVFYHVLGEILKIDDFINKGDISKAEECLENSKSILTNGREQLITSGLYRNTGSDAGNSEMWLKYLEEKTRQVEIRLSFQKKLSVEISKKNLEKCIHVGVYNGGRDGKVNYETIYNCLNREPDILAEYIDNLMLKTMLKYQVIVLPKVQKFSQIDHSGMGEIDEGIYRQNLRKFVLEKGGGVYLEHDNVGFYRGVIKTSIFPEISKGGIRREESSILVVSAEHPALDNMKKGTQTEHMYWDRILQEVGPYGLTILSNPSGEPVVIVGEVGKGRVVSSGMVTYGRDDKPKEDAEMIEKVLLPNSIRWLAGQKNIINREDK